MLSHNTFSSEQLLLFFYCFFLGFPTSCSSSASFTLPFTVTVCSFCSFSCQSSNHRPVLLSSCRRLLSLLHIICSLSPLAQTLKILKLSCFVDACHIHSTSHGISPSSGIWGTFCSLKPTSGSGETGGRTCLIHIHFRNGLQPWPILVYSLLQICEATPTVFMVPCLRKRFPSDKAVVPVHMLSLLMHIEMHAGNLIPYKEYKLSVLLMPFILNLKLW